MKKKVLIIDNYDSFVWNLYQAVGKFAGHPEMFRNDGISIDQIRQKKFTHIIFSPGPGSPEKAKDIGVCLDILREVKLPIFGVCLGFQAIAYFFGQKIIHAPQIFHGKTSLIKLTTDGEKSPIFTGIPNEFQVMRYHSLVPDEVPNGFKLTSQTEDQLMMSFEDRQRNIFGVQFHPESFATEYGEKMLANFLKINTGMGIMNDEL